MKILIVKSSSLGDIVQCFPVIDYLKRQLPRARIDWVSEATFAPLVEAHPQIERVISIDSKKWRGSFFRSSVWSQISSLRKELQAEKYDWVIDLQGNMKSAFIVALTGSKRKIGYGFKTAREWPNAFFTSERYNPSMVGNVRYEYLNLVQSLFQDTTSFTPRGVALSISSDQEAKIAQLLRSDVLQNRILVMVSPGSNWKNKQLSNAALEQFLRLMQRELQCAFLFTWGSQSEKEIAAELLGQFKDCGVLVDRLALPVLQNLMGRVDLVFAMDSLPLHLAATTATPTYSVFGASSAMKYKPLGERHHALQGACPYGVAFERRCAKLRSCETGACIQSLSGEAVFAGFQDWWERVGGSKNLL